MDVNRLTIEERNQLMKEERCFKCRNTGHRANECPEEENDKKKGKEVPKEMTEEDRDEFLKDAEEAGF
jgi:Zinc knuckle